MSFRLMLCAAAATCLLGSAAIAAEPDTGDDDAPTPAAAATMPTPALPAHTVTAVHPAMAEVFRPAPVPGEDEHAGAAGSQELADAGPSLHPNLLSVHERSDGALGNTDIAYDRNQRMRPAGGMSLDIPMQ